MSAALGRILVVDDKLGARNIAAVAGQHLEELVRLLSIAGALGDLPGSDRTLVETALEAARRSLPGAL